MYKPVNRLVFVKVEKPPATTESGIHLPTESINAVQTRGEVIRSNSALCKPGDKVLFNRASGVGVPTSKLVGAEMLMAVYERDLMGVDNGNDEAFPILPPKD